MFPLEIVVFPYTTFSSVIKVSPSWKVPTSLLAVPEVYFMKRVILPLDVCEDRRTFTIFASRPVCWPLISFPTKDEI